MRALLVSVLALSATACTVISGIDDLHPHQDSPDAATTTSPTKPVDAGADAALDISPPSANACTGADGQWTTCNADTTDISSCADRCAKLGKTCVERCCATDTDGTSFVGDGGLAYAYTTECSAATEPKEAVLGTCADPTLYVAATLPVRCCCAD